jgi:hypothetical protein
MPKTHNKTGRSKGNGRYFCRPLFYVGVQRMEGPIRQGQGGMAANRMAARVILGVSARFFTQASAEHYTEFFVRGSIFASTRYNRVISSRPLLRRFQ